MATETEKVIFDIQIEDDGAVESIDSLRKSTRELTKERNALNLATEEGRKRSETLNKQIDLNNQKVKENSSALEKQRQNVGNYSKSIQDAAGQMGVFGNSLGGAASQMQGVTAAAKAFIATPIGAIVAAVAAAIAIFAEGLKKSEVALDLIEDVTATVSNAFGVLTSRIGQLLDGTRSLTNLFSGFTEEVKEAVTQGQLYIDILRDLEDAQFKFRIENAAAENQIKALVVASKNRNLSFKEQEDLLKQALELERALVEQRTELANTEAIATIKQLALERGVRQSNEETFRQFVDRIVSTGVLGGEITKQIVEQIEKVEAAKSSSLAFEEKVSNQLDAINQKRILEEEKLAEYRKKVSDQKATALDGEVKQVETAELQKLQLTTDFAALNLAVKQKQTADEIALAEKQKKTEEFLANQRLMTARALYFGLGQVLSAFGIKNKAISSAMAYANTFLGVTEILKAPTSPFVEPFASVVRGVQIASTIATGLGAVQRINSVSGFANGGLTGTRIGPGMGASINRSNGDNMLATVKTGEVILNQSQQARLGGASTFARIGVPGFATGGVTGTFETSQASATASQSRVFSNLMKAIEKQKIVLPYEDFEIFQQTRTTIQETARVL